MRGRQAAPADGAALRVDDLVVRRDRHHAVDGVSLAVQPGGWLALVGPNGAGKTSLLHACAGLLPHEGRVVVGERGGTALQVRHAPRRAVARAVALVPQRPVVPDGVPVRDLVALGRTPHAGPFGGTSARDRAVVAEVLERLDLVGLAGREAASLSGGELQRVVLARALAQEPRLLLLDEPTSALDLGHQQSVLDAVDRLRVDDGIAVVSALHDLTLAAQYADRLVLLERGRLRHEGAPHEVLEAGRLREVYRAHVDVLDVRGLPAVVPVRVRR